MFTAITIFFFTPAKQDEITEDAVVVIMVCIILVFMLISITLLIAFLLVLCKGTWYDNNYGQVEYVKECMPRVNMHIVRNIAVSSMLLLHPFRVCSDE